MLSCAAAFAAVLGGAFASAAAAQAGSVPPPAGAPVRVVSINLCTDQLAMLLAAPGQLLSVSHIAMDPRASAMVEEAASHVINHGMAEEIYLMQPDLVVAGSYSARATVDMLQRLGIPVVRFDVANSLDDVRDRITQMGAALHREEAAAALLMDYDARRAALEVRVGRDPRAVLYFANGYTNGDKTLAGQILLAAGFTNAASEAGIATGRHMPLEVLAMTNPDMVITGRPYPGASRSEEVMDHPVVRALRANHASATMMDHDWLCGTPFVLRAIETLSTARGQLIGGEQ